MIERWLPKGQSKQEVELSGCARKVAPLNDSRRLSVVTVDVA